MSAAVENKPDAAVPAVEQAGAPPVRPANVASLYVGDLDPNVREQQLLELFRTCGTVLNVRVCRDIITQRSLGYGYVNFQDASEAEKALNTLNFKQVGDKYIRLMWQQRDPSLRYSGSGNIFVKNLDEKVDSKDLHEMFKAFGSILSCKVMADEHGHSRRYGFVHFKSEDAASEAIKNLNKGGRSEDGKPDPAALYVAHFIRRNARIAALLANFTNVYIKQVLPTIDKETIEKFFAKFGGITSAITKTDAKGRVFAFCNFASHDDAVKAIEAVHGKEVEGITAAGESIYVQRAQPRSERLVELRGKYMQRQSLGNNLYVRNFDPDFTDEQLRELFREYGEIRSCRVMTDEKGNSRGFGFVSFHNAEQANQALREMNGRMLNGKPLVVNIAQRRDQRYSMLQVQFQQRLQAMLQQRLPMMPFMQHAPMHAPGPHQGGQQQQQGGQRLGRKMRNGGNNNNGANANARGSSNQPNHRQHIARGGRQGGRGNNNNAAAAAAEQPTLDQGYGTPQQGAQIPETPPLAPITAEELMAMPVDDQKTALGERLYVKVHEITAEHAPKITGMFLEMEPLDALAILDNPTRMKEKVEEALCVLRAHQLEKK